MDKNRGAAWLNESVFFSADFSSSNSLIRENDGNERKIMAECSKKMTSGRILPSSCWNWKKRARARNGIPTLFLKGNLWKSETYEKSSRIIKSAFHGFLLWLITRKNQNARAR